MIKIPLDGPKEKFIDPLDVINMGIINQLALILCLFLVLLSVASREWWLICVVPIPLGIIIWYIHERNQARGIGPLFLAQFVSSVLVVCLSRSEHLKYS